MSKKIKSIWKTIFTRPDRLEDVLSNHEPYLMYMSLFLFLKRIFLLWLFIQFYLTVSYLTVTRQQKIYQSYYYKPCNGNGISIKEHLPKKVRNSIWRPHKALYHKTEKKKQNKIIQLNNYIQKIILKVPTTHHQAALWQFNIYRVMWTTF